VILLTQQENPQQHNFDNFLSQKLGLSDYNQTGVYLQEEEEEEERKEISCFLLVS